MTEYRGPGQRARLAHAWQRVRPLLWPLVLSAAVITLCVTLAITNRYEQHRVREAARLEAMADLRAGQVSAWLREKLGQVRFAGVSPLGELYVRWRDSGDASAHGRLVQRLDSFNKASGGHSALVLDAQGNITASDLSAAPPTAALRAAVARAIERNAPQFTNPHGHGGPAPAPRIDVVAPLAQTGSPASAVLVLRLDPREVLYPLLAHWPLPSETAAALLIHREGDGLVGQRGRINVPLSAPDVLAARVLRGEAPQGQALQALDFRGRPVLGVLQPVSGTDWFLVAKIDQSEVYAQAHRDAWWMAAAGMLAWLATGAVAHLVRQRHLLREAHAAQARQEAGRQQLEALVEQRTHELEAKNQSLQRSVHDLEAFSASVSHDLRGPLRTISGFATLLTRNEAVHLSDQGRHQLSRIVAGSATMDQMIEDILRCSRAERVELRFGPVDLNLLVGELAAELAPAYPATRITLDALPVVHADAAMAQLIYANLLGNALKFSAGQPQPEVTVGMLDSPGGPCVFVRDNGVGFDMERVSQLFAPFQRLHNDSQFPGTGVGLSIVKRLIERHGGSIEADSVPGRQTTFTLCFGPAAPAAQYRTAL